MRWQPRPLRVLIVSATVGGGDAGNARELARRLVRYGHEAEIRDFLKAPPVGIGSALSKGYEAELRHAPWAYEVAFRVWFWFPFLLPPMARFLSLFTRRQVVRWVRETHADVVVSTYPVATQVLGDMRRAPPSVGGGTRALGSGSQSHYGLWVPPVLGAPWRRPQPGGAPPGTVDAVGVERAAEPRV